MKVAPIHHSQTHLSALLAEVEAGEELLLPRHGKPVARISAASTPREPREAGAWRGWPAGRIFGMTPRCSHR